MEPNPLDFWDKYELIQRSDKHPVTGSKSTTCRYCGLAEPRTSFRQKTHLLPELLGANHVLTFDECDKCNGLFSGYESHLSLFFRPHLTLLGVRGKKGVPKFQSRTVNGDENTRATLAHREENRKELYIKSLDDYTIDTENNTFGLVFRTPPLVPLKVFKALLKIGLSLLPPSFDHYNHASFAWLANRRDDITFIPSAFASTLQRSRFAHPIAYLYRAKALCKDREEYPEHTLVLCFANQAVQVFLPFSEELQEIHSEDRNLVLTVFPGFAFDLVEAPAAFQLHHHDLGSEIPITIDHTVSFSYGSAEINIPSRTTGAASPG